MAFAIYKPDQGYWTRMLTAVGAGVLVLGAIGWLVNELGAIQSQNRLYIQTAVGVSIFFVCAGILWWVLNNARVVDFMIATEAEMKKVNWPSRREIVVSTWVVIAGTALLALLLFGIDLAFARLFVEMGVLEG